MRDPGAIAAVGRLALLVLAHFGHRALVDLRITPARNERRHPANRVRAAFVAGANEQLRVCAHERHRHRQLRAVGQNAPAGASRNALMMLKR